MIKNYKPILVGVVIGLIAPLFPLWIFYITKFGSNDFSVFVSRLIYSTLFGPVLSLCALINLLIFFIFIWLNRDGTSWGVLLSTIIYAFIVFGFKLFGE